MSQRLERIDELLRQEIGQALQRDLADPGIGFATVTKVETSPDLSHARVWFSVIGSEEQRKETFAALRRAMPYVRRGLGGKLSLRRIPELDVRLDESVERGTRVLRIINELEAGRLPEEDLKRGESLPTPVRRLPHEGDAPELEIPAPPPPSSKAKRKPERRSDGKPGAGRAGKPGSKGGSRPASRPSRDDGRRGSR